MSFEPPNTEEIKIAYPSISDLERFGGGGFKVVYKAVISGNKEIFKLVHIPGVGATDEEVARRKESLGRIRREVEILGKMTRPEIVKLGSIAPTIVTIAGKEYLGYSEEQLGTDLEKIIKQKGPKPSEDELKRLLLALLNAITELWSHRYVHRDIKPANVLKTDNPTRPFVLLDLGIAYSLLDTGLTLSPGSPATPRYLAPELTRPDFRSDIDFRSDLYTTGLTVFEYAAQYHPLARTEDDIIATITRAIQQLPIPLRKKRPDLPDSFCRMIDQMLKKKPALRPSNLPMMIQEVEKSL